MAAINDILGGYPGDPATKIRSSVAPPPVDSQLSGAPAQLVTSPEIRRGDVTEAIRQKPDGGTVGTYRRETKENNISTSNEPDHGNMSYAQLYEALHPNKPETAEERAKREKKEKRKTLFSAISDGISALSNLYFTTRYAPNAYDPTKSMSSRTRDRLERLRQEREAKSREYRDGYLRAILMDRENDKAERSWRHTLEREKIADERYQVQEAREKAMADLNEKLKGHQITAAEYKAEQERIAVQFAEETEKLKQDKLKSEIGRNQAAAGASRASEALSNTKAESERKKADGEFRAWDRNGKVKYFKGKDAADDFAKQEGTFHVERVTVTETTTKPDNFGRPRTSSKSTTRDTGGYPEPFRPPLRDPGNTDDHDDFSEYEVKPEESDDDFSEYEKK